MWNNRFKGLCCGALAAMAYGMNPLFTLPLYKIGMTPDTVLFYRYFFAMALLGILIRPPLMVCGFFAAVILMNVVGRLLGAGFEIFVGGTMQTKIIGITGTFAMLVILGIVVIMTANKFFSLIHYLPEHVTNWIGQQFHALGEKEDQAGVKNVFVGSTNAVSSGAHGARELRGDISRQWNNPGAGNARTSTPQPPASSPRPGLTQQNFRS